MIRSSQNRCLGYCASLALMLWVANLHADNWPMWRGAKGDGVAEAEKNAPLQWDESKNVTWKAPVTGTGSSTPIVWGDRIFMTSQTEDEKEWVIGINRADGKTLWERQVGQGMTKTRAGANMASASPATDGERVIAAFGTGELVCFDFEGKELWKHDLQKENGKFTIWWGYSNSPVIHGDQVFVTVINEGPSYLLALDKKSGKVLWKTDRKTEAKSEPCDSYATPIVYAANNREEVFITGALYGTAYNPADGKELWRANVGGDRTILSPVFRDGAIYVTAGKRGEVHAIVPPANLTSDQPTVRWKHADSTPDVPAPVVVGDLVYLINDTGIAICLDKNSGAQLWKERIGGDTKASPVAAAGRIYFTNKDAVTTVVEAGRTYKVLQTNKLGEEAAMASLAFSDGQIFHRALHHLYCIGERNK